MFVLSNLCTGSAPNLEIFLREDGLQAVIVAMNRNKQAAAILKSASEICSMASGFGRRAFQVGGIAGNVAEALISTIRIHHKKHADAVGSAMQALHYVFHLHEAEMPKADVLEALITCTRALPHDVGRQMVACIMFRSLCCDEERMMQTMWREGVITIVLRALDLLLSSRDLESVLKDSGCSLQDILTTCTSTISKVYAHATGNREQSGLHVLPRAMRMLSQNVRVQGSATNALRLAVTNHVKKASHVGKEGFETIFQGMYEFRRPAVDPQVQIHTKEFQAVAIELIATATKSEDPSVIDILRGAECTKAVIAVTKAYAADIFVAQSGVRALAGILTRKVIPEIRIRVISQGAPEALCAAMSKHKEDLIVSLTSYPVLLTLTREHISCVDAETCHRIVSLSSIASSVRCSHTHTAILCLQTRAWAH
jgi:hypothetical protein